MNDIELDEDNNYNDEYEASHTFLCVVPANYY